MSSHNHVLLMGYLGNEPSYTSANNGKKAFAITSLATHDQYTSADGNLIEKTQWHRISFHGKLADVAYKYLHKGNHILVEGRLNQHQYKDKDGNNQTDTYVEVNNLKFLGKKTESTEADLAAA